MLLREGQIRIPSGCAISGIMNRDGEVFSGHDIIRSIALMHDRSNGLGGGFAAYGIYPDYPEHYALHMFFEDDQSREATEVFFNNHFDIEVGGKIPTRKTVKITNAPLIWRYFVLPKENKLVESGLGADEYMARCVMRINSEYPGAFVASSGKNMGAFKGVGYPEEIGEFYKLDTYKGYLWTAHGRFPTNTPGWWGGAHPFTLLDWSIVHNGEISSYDANRRYLEMFGYRCSLQTDTEAITYAFDLLLRKHGLPLHVAVTALAAPFWSALARMDDQQKALVKAVRTVYSSLLINGPFSIILGSRKGFVALNDRLKLRSLVAAEKGAFIYVASEESAIREVCAAPDKVWSVGGGEPVIGLLKGVDQL
ncbi:class II glutamine amidotransferase [Heliophilum fasciatum]|uniref:Glutamate synthase (NADPH) GltB1 subunit n=1 Tax=Heliophilum fasciatum TaxID=35700 RepID=A0A4R2RXI0_9FIRM|nr:glutamine amidotransferase family protein [Heliophilum fasciatum]MCW2277161.1 glutamate synthase domain-containing protein 1 [Heliophilum fasciatum]TCP68204.1 glutamate synthase (NADPH) GltB1 subunit [Heliophilum fasciatum]